MIELCEGKGIHDALPHYGLLPPGFAAPARFIILLFVLARLAIVFILAGILCRYWIRRITHFVRSVGLFVWLGLLLAADAPHAVAAATQYAHEAASTPTLIVARGPRTLPIRLLATAAEAPQTSTAGADQAQQKARENKKGLLVAEALGSIVVTVTFVFL